MLVCSVSLQVPRTISANIAEAAAAAAVASGHIVSTFVDIVEAADATATAGTQGNVYPALVDDPASATDHVDAKVGSYMVEAASASDTVSAGSAYGVAVAESVTATDVASGSTVSISTRSAMVIGSRPVFINPGAFREANANGVMINL